MLWVAEASTWGKHFDWWIKICDQMLWYCWYVQCWFFSCLHKRILVGCRPVTSQVPNTHTQMMWCIISSYDKHLLFQGLSSSWGPTTCCWLLEEGRLVLYAVTLFILSPRVKWFHFQILLFSPILPILRMRTGPLSIPHVKHLSCTFLFPKETQTLLSYCTSKCISFNFFLFKFF